MSHKSMILAIIAAALVIGLGVAGCTHNRRRTASAAPSPRQAARQSQNTRPAEVMAATAVRPAYAQHAYANYVAQRDSAPVQDYYLASAPQTRAAPVAAQPPVYSQPQLIAYQPASQPVHYARPITAPRPVVAQPARTVEPRAYHPTPELAMAAAMQPHPVAYQPAPPTRSAPIPELSPVRAQRLPSTVQHKRPAAEIMISSSEPVQQRQEVQRALAPLPQANPVNDWVASPTIAMNSRH